MPDGSRHWPKQITAYEANLSLAAFTQHHVSTWLWLGARAQAGYDGLFGQTCGSQYSYLMLKKRLQHKLKKYQLWHMPANEFAKKARNIHQIWPSDSPLNFVLKFVHKFVCKFVCKFVNQFVKPCPKFRQLLLTFSSGAALNFVRAGPKFRQAWP